VIYLSLILKIRLHSISHNLSKILDRLEAMILCHFPVAIFFVFDNVKLNLEGKILDR
jgi:hypothetical protein